MRYSFTRARGRRRRYAVRSYIRAHSARMYIYGRRSQTIQMMSRYILVGRRTCTSSLRSSSTPEGTNMSFHNCTTATRTPLSTRVFVRQTAYDGAANFGYYNIISIQANIPIFVCRGCVQRLCLAISNNTAGWQQSTKSPYSFLRRLERRTRRAGRRDITWMLIGRFGKRFARTGCNVRSTKVLAVFLYYISNMGEH